MEICLYYLEKDFEEFGGEMTQLNNIWSGTEFLSNFMNSFTDFYFNWFTLNSLSSLAP